MKVQPLVARAYFSTEDDVRSFRKELDSYGIESDYIYTNDNHGKFKVIFLENEVQNLKKICVRFKNKPLHFDVFNPADDWNAGFKQLKTE